MSQETRVGQGVPGAVRSLRLKVSGHSAHYLEAGSGPPIVLLHGGASDSRDWVNTMNTFAASHNLYAPDLIGYGQSERNRAGYYLSDFVEFALGFVEKLGLKSYCLVGHSIGGRVCLEIALSHPEMVSKLVLIDSVGFCKLTFLGAFLGSAAWAVRGMMRAPQPYPRFLKAKGEDREWRCVDRLPSLKTPTLLVWHDRDPYYPLTRARRAAQLIPEARLEVVPGFGHAPHTRTPDRFNEMLHDFLKDR